MEQLNSHKRYCFMPLIGNEKDLTTATGIYAICVKDIDCLPKEMKNIKYSHIDNFPVIYIGKSEKGIKTRPYKDHFNGSARRSTARKSLGSLFGLKKSNVKNKKYSFTTEGENQLSEWMCKNLFFYYWLIDKEKIKEIEDELIKELNPPLNLDKNKSITNKDFRDMLSKLRNSF